jgi:hypothetical protein
MTLPASESFSAADGAQVRALTGWSGASAGGLNDMDVQSNGACPDGAASITHADWWDADAFDDDHYSQAEVARADAGGVYVGLCVRAGGTDGGGDLSAYVWTVNADDQGYLDEFVGGAWTAIANGGGTIAVSDTLRMEAEGTTLRTKINGVTDFSVTDNTIASGAAGIAGYEDGVTSRLDNWQGGNLGGAAAAAPKKLAALGAG